MTCSIVLCDEFTLDAGEITGFSCDSIASKIIYNLELHRTSNYVFVNDILEKIETCKALPGFLKFTGTPTSMDFLNLFNIRFCAVFENEDTAMIAKLSI